MEILSSVAFVTHICFLYVLQYTPLKRKDTERERFISRGFSRIVNFT